MTISNHYTAEQALSRDLLILALNGASLYWVRVHGYTVDCPPDQVRAEGVDTTDRSVWIVDLDDMIRAVTKLIQRPLSCGDAEFVCDVGMLTCVGSTLAIARARNLASVANLPAFEAGGPGYNRLEFEQLIADVVFQVAVHDEVIR